MGIIAGIAIPTTIAVINRQKRNAAKSSAQTVYDSAKSVLLEASTGQSIDYVDEVLSGTTVTGYKTTAAQLAANSEIEKNPCDTGSTMTITYVLPVGTTAAYYKVEVSDGFKINGVNVYVVSNADNSFKEFTTTAPSA